MKEITRIHIAKVPYGIELGAKKDLSDYLDAIRRYAGDDELVEDVEARMVEILNERGIQSDGVITANDVAALREQLGAPADFGDGARALVDEDVTEKPQRRLYRDTNNAVLGGVIAGLARYFSVDVWLLRFIVIVLALVSFGTVLIVYLVLWLVVPPARSAADILQLEGKPATVAAIHNLNESGSRLVDLTRDRRILRGLSTVAGVVLLIGAMCVVIGTATSAFMFAATHTDMIGTIYGLLGMIAVVGMLLLATLLGLLAYGFLSRKWSKKLITSCIIVTILGVFSVCGFGAGVVWSRSEQSRVIATQTKVEEVATEKGFEKISSLDVQADSSMTVNYHVSTGPAHIKIIGLPGDVAIDQTVDGTKAKLRLMRAPSPYLGVYYSPNIDIYGPSLESLTTKNSMVSYSGGEQSSKKITLSATNSDVGLSGLTLEQLVVSASGTTTIDATSATVQTAQVNLRGASLVHLATVDRLEVISPEACASETPELDVEKIVGEFIYNNKTITATDGFNAPCLELDVDSRD